jgi:hypothetical protein
MQAGAGFVLLLALCFHALPLERTPMLFVLAAAILALAALLLRLLSRQQRQGSGGGLVAVSYACHTSMTYLHEAYEFFRGVVSVCQPGRAGGAPWAAW